MLNGQSFADPFQHKALSGVLPTIPTAARIPMALESNWHLLTLCTPAATSPPQKKYSDYVLKMLKRVVTVF